MAIITRTLLVTQKGKSKIQEIILEDGTVIKPTMFEESDALDIGNNLYIQVDTIKDTQHKINVFAGPQLLCGFWLPAENINWSGISEPT